MSSDAVLGISLHFRDGRPAFPPTYRAPGPYRATIATRIATRENTLVAGEAPAFVHPEKTGSVHQGAEPRRVDLLAEGHRAEADARHFEVGVAEAGGLHGCAAGGRERR